MLLLLLCLLPSCIRVISIPLFGYGVRWWGLNGNLEDYQHIHWVELSSKDSEAAADLTAKNSIDVV